MSLFTLLLFLCICCWSSEKDNKNKSQAPTKGHGTAGYPSPRQPRRRLIAADILPTLLFQSKPFWCIASFLCLHKKKRVWKGHPLWASRYSTKSSNYHTVCFDSTQQLPKYRQKHFLILVRGGKTPTDLPVNMLKKDCQEESQNLNWLVTTQNHLSPLRRIFMSHIMLKLVLCI